jgi:hypothetical protein
MNIDIQKTLSQIETKLSLRELQSAFSLTAKLRSQLIGVINEQKHGDLWTENVIGESSGKVVTLTISEPLPSMKELTASMQDYWLELIHAAIKTASTRQKLPYFDKAFVLIEIVTPKYSDNSQLWDTSNRAINLIINNLKGIFFDDDNFEHMAFGVVGKWGRIGQTIIQIMPYERLREMAKI